MGKAVWDIGGMGKNLSLKLIATHQRKKSIVIVYKASVHW